ncbi:myrosinase 1-like [Schistocerca gregaria]|uniref:myrosinase 1-like n=1 Tax=Schistocerca gregaria TaxID=7010 RepID=UPI00211F3034|nr:myrosinase 1-like [Schistocerca gregaria]
MEGGGQWLRRLAAAVLVAALLQRGAAALSASRAGQPRSQARLYQFPEGFLFGAGTSAVQVEGAWNADGKGENIWDHLLHTRPNFTEDGRNADVADDSYHKYKEDIAALASMGGNVYRFSISWARILPAGDLSSINQAGINHYSNLIDALLEKGITPMVTMNHFDLPQKLQDLGGWTNPFIADNFVDYAKVLYDNFGDRVKLWSTFNQPDYIASGYTSDTEAPALNASGVGDYMAGYTLLMAHARAWRLYDEQYRAKYNGKVGITLNVDWAEPATNSAEDIAAAERSLQFTAGIWAHPIYTKQGDYPEVVRTRVDANSKAEGRLRTRLPPLTPEDINYIRGTADFLSLNHYTTWLVSAGESGNVPSKVRDSGAVTSPATDFPLSLGSKWLRVVPVGLRKTLNWLSVNYPGYPIIVTENGCSDDGSTLDDKQRVAYIRCYLSELLKAINEDGIDVFGYIVWSLIDNFEWQASYTSRFGLYHVDFNDPELPRTAKSSVTFLKGVIAANALSSQYFATDTDQKNSTCYVWPDEQKSKSVPRSHRKVSVPQQGRTTHQRANEMRGRNRGRQGHQAAVRNSGTRSRAS